MRIRSAPASASPMAMAWPMPRVHPVTTAVWSARENSSADMVPARDVNYALERRVDVTLPRIEEERGLFVFVFFSGM